MYVDNDTSDHELVIGALEDADNFGHIIDRYEKPLDRYIKSISGAKPDDRQDLLQEIFLSVYQNLRGYKPSMKFSSWVYRIAHNRTISWWRKHKRELTDISVEEHIDFVATLFNENNIEQDIEQDHLVAATKYALANVKEQYRQILILGFWEEKSYKEISVIMNSSVGTVGTRMKRAKKQFINKFKEYEQN